MLTPPTELSFLCVAMRREKNENERHEGYFTHLFPHVTQMRMCGEPPYYLVRVTLTTDGPYWGWWSPDYRDRDTPIHFIFPARLLLEMCFTYGPDVEEARDRGRVVRCDVEMIRVLTSDETKLGPGDQIAELR